MENKSTNIKTKKTSYLFMFVNNLKHIIRLFKNDKLWLFIAILFALGSTLFGVIGPKILSNATNELFYGLQDKLEGSGQINFSNLFYFLGMALIVFVLSSVCQCAQNIISTNVSKKVCYDLRKKLVHKINCLPVSYFEHNSKGNIMSRVLNDVDVLAQNISNILIDFVKAITLIIGSVIMMFSINYLLTIIVILMIPTSLIIISVIISFSQKHFLNQQNTIGQINAYIVEHISGHKIIDIFNKQNEAIEEFNNINKHLYKESIKARIISQVASPLFDFVKNLAYIIVVIFGAYLSIIGNFTVGGIQAFIQYINNFTNPLYSIISIFSTIQQIAAASMRIEEFLETEDEKDNDPISNKKLMKNYKEGDPVIRFKNVTFGYTEEKNILDNLSFDIYKGQTIAIIGPTGAGKTTIAKLLMRFYDTNSGSIELFHNDIKNVNKNQLREYMSMVLQDVWLFSDTIEENIRYGKQSASHSDVIKASKVACSDDFINKLKKKYNTKISERAKNLSLGQKQLISITRAIIANKEILIFDEATSSVDTKTERKLYNALNNITKNKTSIVIAHRLSTIKNADLILVLNNGKIIEKGKHDELINNKGFYYELIQSAAK